MMAQVVSVPPPLSSQSTTTEAPAHTMRTNIVNRLASKIKSFLQRLRQNKNKTIINVNNDNGFNESYEEIINDNLYNERLEAALASLLAQSPACQAQNLLSLQGPDGVSVSLYSGCQVATAQVS